MLRKTPQYNIYCSIGKWLPQNARWWLHILAALFVLSRMIVSVCSIVMVSRSPRSISECKENVQDN